MADVEPLQALHYDLAKVGGLQPVAAPPYDVIDAAQRAQLLGRSPYNVVEVDLPQNGADPLVSALSGPNPNQNPFGFIVDPRTGAVSRPSFSQPNDPLAPPKPSLEPVYPADRQLYLEWLTGASGNYPPGVMSPEICAPFGSNSRA